MRYITKMIAELQSVRGVKVIGSGSPGAKDPAATVAATKMGFPVMELNVHVRKLRKKVPGPKAREGRCLD